MASYYYSLKKVTMTFIGAYTVRTVSNQKFSIMSLINIYIIIEEKYIK